jgi:hypothetical protein
MPVMPVSDPTLGNKIWDHITFANRGTNSSYSGRIQEFAEYEDAYVFNEYQFFIALSNYITRTDKGLSDDQIRHILNSFGSAPAGSFLHELHQIYSSTRFNGSNGPIPPIIINSMSEILITLCENIQQDGMHDFYELGRVLVANFKFLVKKYINHGKTRPFIHLKEEHYDNLGFPMLEKFAEEDHPDGKYFIDTLSKQLKKKFASVYSVSPQERKNPPWLKSTDPDINHITTSMAAILDGTGSIKNTERCIKCDNVQPHTKIGAIELGIYSIGAMVLGCMYDLVCYIGENDATYKYLFYPYFKFDGNDDKRNVFKTKSVLMVLVRYDPIRHVSDHVEILVDNRTFTVANISKEIYKVYKTIDKEKAKPNNETSSEWFNKLKTDNLFMGILKLCVPTAIRTKITNALANPAIADHPTWRDVEGYIENARNLYTKFKIFGKGLGDFNQAFEELVLNILSSYRVGGGEAGKFVLSQGQWENPDISTAPVALLTIDKNLAIVCKTIGAPVLLSQPGYFSINPDAVYKVNQTLQECHNAFNSVPIFIAKYGDLSDNDSKLLISMAEANSTENLRTIDLRSWIFPPWSSNNNTVVIEEYIVTGRTARDGRAVLKITIQCDANLLVTASLEIITFNGYVPSNRRVYAGNLLDSYENLEVTLKENLKKAVDDKRFFISYYPPRNELYTAEANFKFKHLYCGTFKEVLSDRINAIMYKPVRGDTYAAVADSLAARAADDAAADVTVQHNPIPYDPRVEFFRNIRNNKSYWTGDNQGNWKPDVRKFRLKMKSEFDGKTKLDKCREAFLEYSGFDMVYPFKSDQLNDEIEKICGLNQTQDPADTLQILLSQRSTYFKAPFDDELKRTTSYLDLVDSIKGYHLVQLTASPFANRLNELLAENSPLNGSNILTLDKLIECMELLTTPVADQSIIWKLAAYPKPVLSNPGLRGSYDNMIDNFTKLLYDMSQNFKNIFNRTILPHFRHHNDIYTELKSEIETLHGILFAQHEDLKKLMSLYSNIPDEQYEFYLNTKRVYKNLILTKGFKLLKKLIEMLIKVKRRYFQLLSIIERDDNGKFNEIIEALRKELNGLDDNESPAASGQQGNISSTYVQAAVDDADLSDPTQHPDTHLNSEELHEIDEAKKVMLQLYDPDKNLIEEGMEDDALEERLQTNLNRDIADAKKAKEHCEVFMRINDDLDKLYTKCLNSAYSIAEICLKGRGEHITKANKTTIYNSLKNFKDRVQALFCNHPFSNIVKFYTEFNLLLELENLVFILYEKVKALNTDGVLAMSPEELLAFIKASDTEYMDEINMTDADKLASIKELMKTNNLSAVLAMSSETLYASISAASHGGNIGYKYKKNKKKRKLYMKGGISNNLFEKLEYSIEKRITALNENKVDNLYDIDNREFHQYLKTKRIDETQFERSWVTWAQEVEAEMTRELDEQRRQMEKQRKREEKQRKREEKQRRQEEEQRRQEEEQRRQGDGDASMMDKCEQCGKMAMGEVDMSVDSFFCNSCSAAFPLGAGDAAEGDGMNLDSAASNAPASSQTAMEPPFNPASPASPASTTYISDSANSPYGSVPGTPEEVGVKNEYDRMSAEPTQQIFYDESLDYDKEDEDEEMSDKSKKMLVKGETGHSSPTAATDRKAERWHPYAAPKSKTTPSTIVKSSNKPSSDNVRMQGGLKTKLKPKAETNKPKAEAKKPKAETNKPKEEAKKPKEEAKKPKAEAKKPKAETNKPKEETKKPKVETNKPKEETKKPKVEAKKPKAESKIAKTEAKKPKAAKAVKETKPKAEAKKPKAAKAVKETKPKAEAKKPKAKPKRNLLLKFKF